MLSRVRLCDPRHGSPPGSSVQLHTTVIGGRRVPFPFEIQIRTREMHHLAEYGIAAHWRYKEGGDDKAFDKKLYWLRQILDWQSETRDSHEFIDGLKTDLFSEQVFIFTPKGDIITLPQGATVIDFAYAIHSAVGNKMVGAKINGMIAPIDRVPQTGNCTWWVRRCTYGWCADNCTYAQYANINIE